MPHNEVIYNEKTNAAWKKAFALLDSNAHPGLNQQEEFLCRRFQKGASLNELERTSLIHQLQYRYDQLRVKESVKTRICDHCHMQCSAKHYCEFCVRKHLRDNFGNWSSGNHKIDRLIQECQQGVVSPSHIVEWIDYEQLEDISYLKEGGCSTIYTATRKDGCYYRWNNEAQTLERIGQQKVVLKKLHNSENIDRDWFQEVKLQFTLSGIAGSLANCYGLTKDPQGKDYMLVLYSYANDLRKHSVKNTSIKIWVQKCWMVLCLAGGLYEIHRKRVAHGGLHPGNILYNATVDSWVIGDMGFCGPKDKSPDSIYGDLPYIAPEVLCGEQRTLKSDIYSLGILMWEIATGETPFVHMSYNNDLALAIVNGIRPRIYENIPKEYVRIMKPLGKKCIEKGWARFTHKS
ncbi:8875_t:CDS:2 [Acaulospora morrowiae]|uniref:8875_t:CDS:1 n=1 Tax=Acaulospora morrowiae TaxID=94023 RepID=A0A9N9FGZ3_9GLOM|nr:8875_t:CDS:2 [Acaulospora morrowiae]